MVDVTLRVVSGPNEDRTTIQDLVSSLCWVAGFEDPAPRLRRSTVSSFQADGSVDAATAWSDRELLIRFGVDAPNEDVAALIQQILGRVFREPRWLEFKAGTTQPVFYRTRATTLDRVEDFGLSAEGVRVVGVKIPADPAAVGLPVSGTVEVPNDPTDGGMRFTIGDVKGDLPAPLRLSMNFGSAPHLWGERRLIGCSTYGTFHHAVPTLSSPGSGITLDTPTASSAIGGVQASATGTPPSNEQVALATIPFPAVTPGEYRLLVRARASRAARMTAFAFPGGPAVQTAAIPTVWRWLDLGVLRLPAGAPRKTAWSPSTPADTAILAALYATAGSVVTIDVDHAVLIPAPGGDGSDGTILHAQGIPAAIDGFSWTQLVVSGPDEQAYCPAVVGGGSLAASLTGGFPRVVPVATNLVTIARLVTEPLPGITPVADSKAASTFVMWSYHPRYLTRRGD